eukprot:361405-Chlamydomonas_euryale.AAC.1
MSRCVTGLRYEQMCDRAKVQTAGRDADVHASAWRPKVRVLGHEQQKLRRLGYEQQAQEARA